MHDPRLDAITTDLTALEAIVRGLARSYALRSRTSLVELLASLTEEAERVRSCPTFSGVNRSGVCGVLDAWVEDLKVEAWTAEGATVRRDQTV
ncbi:MAG TPA: hypothetical protein VFF48_04685 [Brevundimonas sp.]|nr:hypothetical protein [Brevundimonas sp.]